VGIGTNLPTQLLDVNGTTRTTNLQMTNGAANGYILQSDANGNASWVANTGGTNYWTLSSNSLYNNSGTNVGIGTSSPSDKFHVVGNIRVDGGKIPFVNTGYAVFIGDSAGLNDDLTNNNSVFIGKNAGRANVTGTDNIALGKNTLYRATNANYNVAIGENVLGSATMSGNTNVSIGNFSMQTNTSGTDNIALGQNALELNTIGTGNTVMGSYGLNTSTIGNYNVAIGHSVMQSNTQGNENVSIGYGAGVSNVTGNYNIYLGSYTTGNTGSSNNVMIGVAAGGNGTAGSSNVFLGSYAGYNETTSNKLYIDNSTTSTPLIYGDFSTNKVTIYDSLQSKYLTVTNGAANGYILKSDASGNASWASLSSLNLPSGTGAATQLAYWSGSNALTSSSNLYWDNTNVRLGIGTASPSYELHVYKTGGTAESMTESSSAAAYQTATAVSGQEAGFKFNTYNAGYKTRWLFGKSNGTESGSNVGSDFFINRYDDAGSYLNQPLTINRSSGTVTLNAPSSSSNNTLKVNGSVSYVVTSITTSSNTTTLNGTNYCIIYTGNTSGNTCNLPTASICTGRAYLIINHSSGSVTVSLYNISNGVDSVAVTAGANLQVISDGTNWIKMN
jgi:hypothetical protein